MSAGSGHDRITGGGDPLLPAPAVLAVATGVATDTAEALLWRARLLPRNSGGISMLASWDVTSLLLLGGSFALEMTASSR